MTTSIFRLLAAVLLCTLAPCLAKEPKPTPKSPELSKPEEGTLTLIRDKIIFENERGKLNYSIGGKPGLEVIPGYKSVDYAQDVEVRDGKAVDISKLTLQNIFDKTTIILCEGQPLKVVQLRDNGRTIWKPAK